MPPELENIVESIIFASPEGASTKEITRCVRGAVATAREANGQNADEAITRFADTEESQVVSAIAHLNAIYDETGRAFCLVERPAGWRIMSRAEFSPWVRELFPDKKPARLTPSALETLAIIAYRQPITKSSIEAVRGVSVDGPVSALMDRNVIRIAGRADLPGRPLLYETTDVFLEHFGIKTVDELPNASELRSVKLPEPEPVTPPSVDPQTELPLEGGTEGSASDVSEGENGAAPATPKSKKKGKSKKSGAATNEEVNTASPLASPEENAPTPAATPEPDGEWSPAEEPEPEADVDLENSEAPIQKIVSSFGPETDISSETNTESDALELEPGEYVASNAADEEDEPEFLNDPSHEPENRPAEE